MKTDGNLLLDTLWRPRLMQVDDNFFVAAFPFMKVLTAWGLIRAAEQEGFLSPDTLVVESTSGNLGIGLAIVCAQRGQPLLIIADTNLNPDHRRRMEDLGATVVTVAPISGKGGSQAARLDRIDQELARSAGERTFVVYQYMREANKSAYGRLAALLAGEIPHIDCLVGTVGTGGSMCGTARYLRMLNHNMHAVGVDVHSSVLFGQTDGPRHIGGLGASVLPPGLEHSTFDEVHWLSAAAAANAGQDLHRATGLFQGPTSGLAWKVGRWYAAQHPDRVTVAILPDEGHRYADTLYNPVWRHARQLPEPDAATEPVSVSHPLQAKAPIWTRIAWCRRTLKQVLETVMTHEGH